MKTLLSLAAFAIAVTAAPAVAQPPASAVLPASAILVVRTADLDLRSPAGISAMDRRIRAVVALACGDSSDVDLHGRNAAGRCRAETLAAVAAQRSRAIALARRGSGTELAAQ
jgi:UrcA family protein